LKEAAMAVDETKLNQFLGMAVGDLGAAISDDGTAMIVEPFANDRVQDDLNPVGRVMYGASTQICGGFTRFRRATETPFNLVLEARP
jgi:hypothetical protein